jgi:hypothetical protein
MPNGILSTSGGRLEEMIAGVVARFGPFVAVGAPDESLPQLGAARAYLPRDDWQNTIIDWVDAAQLIILVAGTTHWVRWEFNMVLRRGHWPNLIVVMPPSARPEHNAARWDHIIAGLRDSPWRDALAMIDPHRVVALRLLDGGGVATVTSDRRRMVDYQLAMRIMMYQLGLTATP